MRLWTDLKIAVVFLTRVPLHISGDVPPGRVAGAMWAFPVIGALHGLFGGAVFVAAFAVLHQPLAAAVIALCAMLLATGAFHEDGLADTADGLGGGHTKARKLEIMRDSRVGTYGAAALILSLMLRVALIAALPGAAAVAALAASGAWSRALGVVVAWRLPHAAPDGLSKDAGRPGSGAAWAALILAGGIAGMASPFVLPQALWLITAPLAAAALMAAALGLASRAQIGGQTGDVLGAIQQTSEIVFLLALAAVHANT